MLNLLDPAMQRLEQLLKAADKDSVSMQAIREIFEKAGWVVARKHDVKLTAEAYTFNIVVAGEDEEGDDAPIEVEAYEDDEPTYLGEG
jgi:hypothetical protein